MYQFKEEIDRVGHYWFPKGLIENKNWAALESASKAIYPVIGCHRNEHGVAFPGERTIAIFSGRSDKIVRRGISRLEDLPGIRVESYITKRGRRSKRFILKKDMKENDKAFPFHKTILEYGNWLHLISSAQALYPAMRFFSYFDTNICELYAEIEDVDFDCNNLAENYSSRRWEFCEAEENILAEYAGINKRSIEAALKNLEKLFLIEPYCEDFYEGWKVYLHPHRIYHRDYLNELIMKKYQHLNKPVCE